MIDESFTPYKRSMLVPVTIEFELEMIESFTQYLENTCFTGKA